MYQSEHDEKIIQTLEYKNTIYLHDLATNMVFNYWFRPF